MAYSYLNLAGYHKGVEGLSTQGLNIIGTSLKCQLNSSVILSKVFGGTGEEDEFSLTCLSLDLQTTGTCLFVPSLTAVISTVEES